VFGESEEMGDITTRLETLEEGVQRIEALLERLVGGGGGSGSGSGSGGGSEWGGEGVGRPGEGGMVRRATLVELNREAEEE
jgi:hypothetical protein